MPVDEKLYVSGDISDKSSERVERRNTSGTEIDGAHFGVGDIRRNASGVPTTVGAELLGADTTGTVARPAAHNLTTGAGAANTFNHNEALPSGASAYVVVVRDNTTKATLGKTQIAGGSVTVGPLAYTVANTAYEVEVYGVDSSGRAGRGRVGTVTTHA